MYWVSCTVGQDWDWSCDECCRVCACGSVPSVTGCIDVWALGQNGLVLLFEAVHSGSVVSVLVLYQQAGDRTLSAPVLVGVGGLRVAVNQPYMGGCCQRD